MATLKLSNNKNTLVDDEDSDLNDFRWHHNRGYVTRHITQQVKIHRVIMERALGRKLEANEFVDHINGDPLDNRRENLRIVTPAQNAMNQKQQVGRSSKYKGVHYFKANGKWRAKIQVNGKQISLGLFQEERDAALAYNKAACEHFGEYARLNEVD